MTMESSPAPSVPAPPLIWENTGFWEAVKLHQLVFQRCKNCGKWLHPPRPSCPSCRSLEKEWALSAGRGKVHSWVTYRESPHPAFRAPYSVVLVDLEEGVRLVSNIVDAHPDEISIGMPVEITFEDIAGDLTLPRFRKVA